MGKKFNSNFKLFAIQVIICCFTFQAFLGMISTQKVQAADINAFQKFIIEALHLRDTPRHAMTDELFDYFEEDDFDIEQMTSYFEEKYFSGKLSYDELKEALTIFSERSKDSKLGLYYLLDLGAERLDESYAADCNNIIERINDLITGNPQNVKGISTLITLFIRAEQFSEGEARVFAGNGKPVTDIEFVFEGDASTKSLINSAIGYFSSLVEIISPYPGSNNFEKLLSFAQETVNNSSDEEIKAFKYFLKKNGGIYEGDPEAKPPSSSPGGSPGGGGNNSGQKQDDEENDEENDEQQDENENKDNEDKEDTGETEEDTNDESTVEFIDIDHVPWAIESIQALAQKGVIAGMGNGIFAPDNNVTREQFIRMIVYAFDLLDEEAEVDFTDVDKGAWYYQSVASAKKHGITEGLGDGSFGVGREITRQDMCVMLYRLSQKLGIELPEVNQSVEFADSEDIAEYAIDAIDKMQMAGILSGVGDNRFAPFDNATRAQSARVIYLILKLKEA